MRKRQVKKFAQRAKKNMTPYRQAFKGGSKKLDRRRKAFGRFFGEGLAFWDRSRVTTMKAAALQRKIENGQAGWGEVGPDLLGLVSRLGKNWTQVVERLDDPIVEATP